jgi:gliding motility-associated-like protein
MTHYIQWSDYKEFDGPLLGYNIFRGFDGVYSPEPLAQLSKSQHFYEDKLEKIDYSGKTCYFVEAIEGINFYNQREISRSNEVCPILQPIIYIPNTFTPNGDEFNQQFTPILSLFDYSSYSFTIFDRWEHPIFDTNDPTIGWTGEIKSTGKIAESGTYVYLLILQDGNGIEISKRGIVNLLK